ncbi:MAG TPA: nuclear transport factor 2 family protein [Streptosporangiaceae bacterium]|nr:nuclear transport factor 2 family protein [Streptosporangiaceae bacterium]
MDSLEGLRSLEEIRQVKYRSLRCVDLKRWDEIGDVFTEDADLDYGTVAYGKPLQIVGRPGIVAFFRTKLGPDTLTSHSAGQPEITVAESTATGIWQVHDTVLATRHRMLITGAAFHHDRYERGADGRWRVAGTRCVRNYETMVSLDDLPSFKLTAVLDGLLDGQVPDGRAPGTPEPLPSLVTQK